MFIGRSRKEFLRNFEVIDAFIIPGIYEAIESLKGHLTKLPCLKP